MVNICTLLTHITKMGGIRFFEEDRWIFPHALNKPQHPGEQESAALLEDAVWELYSQNCIPLTVAGAVEGGPAVVVKALKPILRKLADRL